MTTGSSEDTPEAYEDMIGATVTDVRISEAASDGGAQRIVIIFENGASIAIEGSFPARATLTEASAFREALVGRRFDAICLSTRGIVDLKDGTSLEALEVRVATDKADVVGEWKAIHSPGFDVEPWPRIMPRPAPSYGTQFIIR